MIATSGINVANCYKQYGGTVDALKVTPRLPLGRIDSCCYAPPAA